MDRCPHPKCSADDNITCSLGHIKVSNCPEWMKVVKTPTSAQPNPDELAVPWSGSALGESDLNFLSGSGKPITVGIVGPESSGKTTVLAAFYLLLGRGNLTSGNSLFSNSYTLAGWEAVANNLRWKPGQAPHFPPHTTSRAARAPGMLHLAFRSQGGALRDLLFADAPGEWFQKWSINQQSAEAEGARWIAKHGDVTLLIADREALAGPAKGTARNEFQLLAQRAAAESHGRRLALVWTKGDVEVAPAMEAQIRKAVGSTAFNVPEFTVSVFKRGEVEAADGFQKLFSWILETRRSGVQLPTSEVAGHDLLFRYGRR